MTFTRRWLVKILKREYARLFERVRPVLVEFDDTHHAFSRDVRHDTAIYVRELLGKLSASERESLQMQVLDGRPVAAIARHFGVSRNAMTIRLHRARKRLRECAATT